MEVLDVNIYGSCLDIIPFWENIFNLNFLGHGNVIMGGDMSFFSGNFEIFFFFFGWGGYSWLGGKKWWVLEGFKNTWIGF